MLRAWFLVRDLIGVELLVCYVERLDIGILRQRVGCILDRLALPNPKRAIWLSRAAQGGSNKRVTAKAYSATYDPDWNLSLNAPVDVLHGPE